MSPFRSDGSTMAAASLRLPVLGSVAELRARLNRAYEWRQMLLTTMGYCSMSLGLRPLAGEGFSQALMRRYFDTMVRQLGIDLVAHGTERLRAAHPCVLAVNHNSALDIPCVGVLLDFDYKWVAKKEIFGVPFVGWHLRACGHIAIDRRRPDNSVRLQQTFHRLLHNGASVLMFPEGTRSQDGTLGQFRTGAFVTAVREGVPVVPIAVNGTEKLLVKGAKTLVSGGGRTVQIQVAPAVFPPAETEGSFDQRVAAMRDQTRAAMVQALDELRGEHGAAERPTLVEAAQLVTP